VIPCRPGHNESLKFETDLSAETVTWSDVAGRDLDLRREGHLKVTGDKSLALKGVQETDAGVYVCTVRKVGSSGAITVVKHVVNLHGNSSSNSSSSTGSDSGSGIFVWK